MNNMSCDINDEQGIKWCLAVEDGTGKEFRIPLNLDCVAENLLDKNYFPLEDDSPGLLKFGDKVALVDILGRFKPNELTDESCFEEELPLSTCSVGLRQLYQFIGQISLAERSMKEFVILLILSVGSDKNPFSWLRMVKVSKQSKIWENKLRGRSYLCQDNKTANLKVSWQSDNIKYVAEFYSFRQLIRPLSARGNPKYHELKAEWHQLIGSSTGMTLACKAGKRPGVSMELSDKKRKFNIPNLVVDEKSSYLIAQAQEGHPSSERRRRTSLSGGRETTHVFNVSSSSSATVSPETSYCKSSCWGAAKEVEDLLAKEEPILQYNIAPEHLLSVVDDTTAREFPYRTEQTQEMKDIVDSKRRHLRGCILNEIFRNGCFRLEPLQEVPCSLESCTIDIDLTFVEMSLKMPSNGSGGGHFADRRFLTDAAARLVCLVFAVPSDRNQVLYSKDEIVAFDCASNIDTTNSEALSVLMRHVVNFSPRAVVTRLTGRGSTQLRATERDKYTGICTDGACAEPLNICVSGVTPLEIVAATFDVAEFMASEDSPLNDVVDKYMESLVTTARDNWAIHGASVDADSITHLPGGMLVPFLVVLLLAKRKYEANKGEIGVTLETYGGKGRSAKQAWDPIKFLDELKSDRSIAGHNYAESLVRKDGGCVSFIILRFVALLMTLPDELCTCSDSSIRMGVGGNVFGKQSAVGQEDESTNQLYMFCKANNIPILSALRTMPASEFFSGSSCNNKKRAPRSLASKTFIPAQEHSGLGCSRQPWIEEELQVIVRMKNSPAFQEKTKGGKTRTLWNKMLDAITNDSYVRTIFADIHLQHATAKQGDMKKESPIVGNVGESLQLYEVPFLESLEELMEQQGEEPWIDAEIRIVTEVLKAFGDGFDWTQRCTSEVWSNVINSIKGEPASVYVVSEAHLDSPLSEIGRQQFVRYLKTKGLRTDAFDEPMWQILTTAASLSANATSSAPAKRQCTGHLSYDRTEKERTLVESRSVAGNDSIGNEAAAVPKDVSKKPQFERSIFRRLQDKVHSFPIFGYGMGVNQQPVTLYFTTADDRMVLAADNPIRKESEYGVVIKSQQYTPDIRNAQGRGNKSPMCNLTSNLNLTNHYVKANGGRNVLQLQQLRSAWSNYIESVSNTMSRLASKGACSRLEITVESETPKEAIKNFFTGAKCVMELLATRTVAYKAKTVSRLGQLVLDTIDARAQAILSVMANPCLGALDEFVSVWSFILRIANTFLNGRLTLLSGSVPASRLSLIGARFFLARSWKLSMEKLKSTAHSVYTSDRRPDWQQLFNNMWKSLLLPSAPLDEQDEDTIACMIADSLSTKEKAAAIMDEFEQKRLTAGDFMRFMFNKLCAASGDRCQIWACSLCMNLARSADHPCRPLKPGEGDMLISTENRFVRVNSLAFRRHLEDLMRSLDTDQTKAANAIIEFKDRNILITGQAGVGKTYFAKVLVKALIMAFTLSDEFALTASTNIAACVFSLDTSTLHSFLGLDHQCDEKIKWDGVDLHQKAKEHCESLLKYRPESFSEVRFRQLKLLVIEEVGQLEGAVIRFLDAFLKVMRGKKDKPFGGVRIIMVGDPLQSQPIEGQFFFQEEAFQNGNFYVAYLKENHRQCKFPRFMAILNRIRIGEGTQADIDDINNVDVFGCGVKLETYEEVCSANEGWIAGLNNQRKGYRVKHGFLDAQRSEFTKWDKDRHSKILNTLRRRHVSLPASQLTDIVITSEHQQGGLTRTVRGRAAAKRIEESFGPDSVKTISAKDTGVTELCEISVGIAAVSNFKGRVERAIGTKLPRSLTLFEGQTCMLSHRGGLDSRAIPLKSLVRIKEVSTASKSRDVTVNNEGSSCTVVVESIPYSDDVAPVTAVVHPVTGAPAEVDDTKRKVMVTRTQLPLLEASALSPWDIQGMTIHQYGLLYDNSRVLKVGRTGDNSYYGAFYTIMGRCLSPEMFLPVHAVTLDEVNRAHPVALAFDRYFRTHASNETLLPMDIVVSPTGQIDIIKRGQN